jgi:hypothetical protein
MFQSILRQILEQYLDSANVSFQITSNSSFISHPIIECYIINDIHVINKQLEEREV